jgi:membrane protease YdiL (CAAX protease family)
MLLANAVLRPGGLARMGVSPRSMRRGVWQGYVGGVIDVPLISVGAQETEVARRAVGYEHPKEHDLLRIMGESEHMPLVALVLIASAVLVAPLFEELLFRGHLQTVVTHALARLSGRETRVSPGEYEIVVPTREAGAAPDYAAPGAVKAGEPIPVNAPAAAARWAAVFLTSLVFASVHPAWTIPPIFVLSLCLGYAYERTGNLWAVMTMHAMFNTTSTVIYLLMSR